MRSPPIDVVPEISQATSDALMIALAKNPSERFRTYDEFIMAFTAARTQLLFQQFRPDEEPDAGQPAPGKGWWKR